MTAQLRARLLGELRFEHRDTQVVPASRKGTALLAYLCLAPAGAQREDLAELFWGSGRLANLRQELYALRRLPGASEWLRAGIDAVAVDAVTDVGGLEATLPPSDVPGEIVTAVLLPGLERIAAPAFRDWLEIERDAVKGRVARALRAAIIRHHEQGRLSEALALVDAALTADPLDEALHRTAMSLTYRQGDGAAALVRYDVCRAALRRELSMEPTAETVALAEAIVNGLPAARRAERGPLEPELELLAQAIAVGDGALGVEALAAVTGSRLLDVTAGLGRLDREGWLDEHQALVPHQARRVLQDTPVGVARHLHGRVADVLTEARDVAPETVAEHQLRAGRPGAAAPLFLRAARARLESSDAAAAVPLLFRAAWAAWESASTRLEVCLLLEGCAAQLGDDELQVAALTEAEDLAWELQRDVDLAEVKLRRSRYLLERGGVGEGMELALDALGIATRLGDAHLGARARNAVGGAQFYAGDLDGAELTFAANRTAADPIERYRARNNLGSIAGIRGRPREALDHLEEALTLARAGGRQVDVVGTLNNLAATAERFGDYPRAVKHFRESLALARRSGAVGVEGQVLVNLSVVFARLGELGPAWNTAAEVEDMAAQLGTERLAMRAREQKAEIAYLCGDDHSAVTEFEAALTLSRALGDERKVLALTAQRSVAASRTAPPLVETALADLRLIADSRWADVTPWLWLELALVTADPVAAGEWVAQSHAGSHVNQHLRRLAQLANLRTGLLPGASAAQLAAAAEAHRGLIRGSPGTPVGRDFVQAPMARLFGELWVARSQGRAAAAPAPEALSRVRHDLEEQAAGLPRALASSLLQRPSTWVARLVGRVDGILTPTA